MKDISEITHKAADFMNAGGEHILCFQLLNENKHAVAVADFRGGRLERFDAAPAKLETAKQWLARVKELLEVN